MNLVTFAEQLNQAMASAERTHRDAEDISVGILLDMPSMGPRRMAEISSVFLGFDWESNRIIISPVESLVTKEQTNDQ